MILMNPLYFLFMRHIGVFRVVRFIYSPRSQANTQMYYINTHKVTHLSALSFPLRPESVPLSKIGFPNAALQPKLDS